jgi:YD repeat-containing protein
MKTRPAALSNPLSATLTFGVALILLPLPSANSQTATGLQVGIAQPSSANESNRTAYLTWTAAAGNNYLVQSSTNLGNPAGWTTEDAVSAGTVGLLKWMAPEALEVQKYYRLILPQPQIFSVEPAIVTPGVPVDFYLLGQNFPANALVQINGVTQSGTVYSNSTSLVQPAFTPAVAGTYQVSLVISGVVVSTFNVVAADPLANPELVLQGPPDEPPAGPSVVKGGGHANESLALAWENLQIKRLSGRSVGGGRSGSNQGSIPLWVNGANSGISDYSFDVEQTLGIGSQASESGGTSRGKDMTGHVTLIRGSGPHGGVGPLATLLMPALLKAKEKANEAWQPGLPDPGGPMATLLMPALMKAKEKANQTKCGNNLRVVVVKSFSGEVQESDVDLAIPGRGLGFVWARTYHSRIGRFGSATNGWTFSYDVRSAQNSSGGLDVYDGTGRKDTFTLGTNGVYTCPEFFREGTLSNNTFTLTFADTGRWVFNPFDGTSTAGKLVQIITRNGDTMTLGYDTSGRLTQVVDDLGRTNTVSYNTAGQLLAVTDFSGRSVTYQYYSGAKADNGSVGDLASVTSPPVTGTPNGNDFPSGKTTTYTYSKSFPLDRENHLLLTVTDPKGQPAAVFSYEHNSTSTNYLRCTAAQEGANTASRFNWSLISPPSSGSAVAKCIVNDPVGDVTEYDFDARNRCVREDDYTGRATPGVPVTDTLNRPTGQLRLTDPAYYETTWSWNNDSLPTAVTAPDGLQLQYVYQSDFDPATTARKRADCRVEREIASSPVDLDGDGVADVTSRAYYYTYDPRFGSSGDRTANGTIGKGIITCPPSSVPSISSRSEGRAISTKGTGSIFRGWDGTVKGNAFSAEAASFKVRGQSGHDTLYAPVEGVEELFVPDGNGMAIRTKGTGADKNRTAGGPRLKSWDGATAGTDFMTGNHKDCITGVDIMTGNHKDLMMAAVGDVDEDGTLDFCISATDPRGNVTTGSYDANGNRIKVQFHWDRQSSAERDFAYDTHGQLTVITNFPDANGHSRVDTFSWSQGQITNCVVDAGGLAITESYEYDARGNLARYVDPRTNDWLFTYNALDQLMQASSALVTANGSLSTFRTASQLAYDVNDNLVQTTTVLLDPTGTLRGSRADNFQYDGEDRLAQVALAVDTSHALTNRFAYDGNDECVQVLGGDAVSGTDPHQTLAYQYDERGLLFHASSAPGSSLAATNEYTYDPNGRITCLNKVEAFNIKQKVLTYDGFSRLSSLTDEMGNQAVYFYDANDNPKVVRLFGELNDVPGSAGNVRLAESDYQYDGLDRCVRSDRLVFVSGSTGGPSSASDSVTTCVYAPNDECVSATDTLGHTTTFGYDTACRPVSVTDALGNQQSVVYDGDGNALAEISSEIQAANGKPQVLAVTNIYDSLNRCVSTTDSAGNTSSYAYDSLDRCVQTIDPRDIYAFYSYDLLDRCTVAIGDLNGDGIPDFIHDITTTYFWSSSSGNLLAVTDSQTNTTSYTYDSLGRCLSVTHADGTQEQMSWDPRSNLIWEQDANGTTITNYYDLSDRIVHRDIAARTTAGVAATTTFETFTYDGCDRLTGAANDSGTNMFAYDSLDDGVSETQNGLTSTSTYDAFGNRLSLTYPGGRALTYTYDSLNRCASITDSGVQLVSYAYDGPNRISQITYGNGTKTQIAYDGFVGKPNPTGDYGFGQISRVRHGIVASGMVIDDRTFSYDPDQNKISRSLTAPFTLGGAAQAMAFQYDNAGRLVDTLVTTNGAVARLTTYGLDRMGNRTNVTGEACSGAYTLNSTIPPGDFQMNRYTTTPCDSRTYNNDGDLVSVSSSAGPVTYQYDYAGRLVQVQTMNSGTGTLTPVVSYTYDAVGRRMHKTVYAAGLPSAATQFLYDGSSVIEERNGTTTTATYVCGDGVQDGNETDLDCGGTCLSMNRGGQNYYLHTDDQGNVLALSGGTGGVVERYDYDDYGAISLLTSDGYPSSATASTVGNVYLWKGLRLDAESGLHNDDGGGYFEPQTGRAIRGKVKNIKIDLTDFIGNNPWSGSGSTTAMLKPPTTSAGHVKFYRLVFRP